MMDNDIIYHLENSEQFWAELGEILTQGENNQDSALNSIDVYIKFVSDFQDEYLENEKEFMQCCYKLFVSPIYRSFSDNIIEHIIQLAAKKTDVKELWVLYNILFLAGWENKKLFKQMMDVQEQKFVSKLKGHIESKDGGKLQQISIKLLFEICRVRRLSADELDLIDELFLNHLLDLVEKTRDNEDETFNYSVIRLILSFNEQFMLAATSYEAAETIEENSNTVLRVLKERIGSSKTFSENVIFMLNRTVDHHIQMLILKLLYEVFTTTETFEYFYTNDLRVLIDVFIRELYDLPEESEALRHTYLRVLYPLITNTQLRQHRYKQHQIYSLLLDLNGSSMKQFKPISPTTQRLVDRCLMSEYLTDIAPSRNCGSGIIRKPTPNALVMGMDTARNTNSSNGNGFTVEVVIDGIM
ncbi:hypothetical protein C1645_871837 [Glomus cerebriforme]|uniref:SPIN90/Ldb17 leucine-rich domain-containing protein n=1 Tax=Glomus cerebriforme TaxID=658196 RepID=A0A397TPE0_9GLOM|nr:hypothetical protein C1645_871837 [Glomus cerebriforme]